MSNIAANYPWLRPSAGELFAELSRQASTLIRQEVRLARVEMSQKASSLGRDVAYLAIGGLVIYAGFLALLAALIIGLAEFMAGWLAALPVSVWPGYLWPVTKIRKHRDITGTIREYTPILKRDSGLKVSPIA